MKNNLTDGQMKFVWFNYTDVMGSTAFKKMAKEIKRGKNKKQKQLLKDAVLARKRFSVKKAKEELGKYGQHKSTCGICADNTLGVKHAVFCHTDGNNIVPHTYCQGCIDQWSKKRLTCPTCRRNGVPLRLYFPF